MALYERLTYDADGRVQSGSLLDYVVPTASQLPPIEAVLVEVPSPEGPYGARGVGEPPIVAPAAAIATETPAALGLELAELPMTPERVVSAGQTMLRGG